MLSMFKEWDHLKLTYYSPVLLFYTPWKHQKTFSFSDVFKGDRKATLGFNGLSMLNSLLLFVLRINFIKNNFIKKKLRQRCFAMNFLSKNIQNSFHKRSRNNCFCKLSVDLWPWYYSNISTNILEIWSVFFEKKNRFSNVWDQAQRCI